MPQNISYNEAFWKSAWQIVSLRKHCYYVLIRSAFFLENVTDVITARTPSRPAILGASAGPSQKEFGVLRGGAGRKFEALLSTSLLGHVQVPCQILYPNPPPPKRKKKNHQRPSR